MKSSISTQYTSHIKVYITVLLLMNLHNPYKSPYHSTTILLLLMTLHTPYQSPHYSASLMTQHTSTKVQTKTRHSSPGCCRKEWLFYSHCKPSVLPSKGGTPLNCPNGCCCEIFQTTSGSLLTCCLCNSLAFQRPWFWSWSRSADPMTVKILSLDEWVCTGTPVTVAWQERLLLYYTGPGSNPSTGLVFWSRLFWFWS